MFRCLVARTLIFNRLNSGFSSRRGLSLLRSTMATSAFQPDWTPSQPSSSVPPFSVFTKPIEKSEQDNREYRLIQLANGLQATVVRDPSADKAAASLDVAVGHLYDPVSGICDVACIPADLLPRMTCLALRIFASTCCLW